MMSELDYVHLAKIIKQLRIDFTPASGQTRLAIAILVDRLCHWLRSESSLFQREKFLKDIALPEVE